MPDEKILLSGNNIEYEGEFSISNDMLEKYSDEKKGMLYDIKFEMPSKN